jgi:hypothetical protein
MYHDYMLKALLFLTPSFRDGAQALDPEFVFSYPVTPYDANKALVK